MDSVYVAHYADAAHLVSGGFDRYSALSPIDGNLDMDELA